MKCKNINFIWHLVVSQIKVYSNVLIGWMVIVLWCIWDGGNWMSCEVDILLSNFPPQISLVIEKKNCFR